jgi:Flp pilus assembly protein TadG
MSHFQSFRPALHKEKKARLRSTMKNKFKALLQNTQGATAIEMAMIFPFMIMLYFGLADLTGLVSLNRKVTYAADVIGDLVSRKDTSVLKSEIADYYNASDMVMAPRATSTVRVELFGFRTVSGTITQIWTTNNGQGSSCGSAPSTASMAPLMTAGNDLIVSRVCTTYVPYVANFLGSSILGASTFNIKKAVTRRPRGTLQLDCYQTTVGGAKCT